MKHARARPPTEAMPLLGPGDVILELPAAHSSSSSRPPVAKQLGRLLYDRLHLPSGAVSRVQAEATVVEGGAALMLRSLGTNPTALYRADENYRRHLVRKGETVVLRDGDGVGLLANELPPGSLRWKASEEVTASAASIESRAAGRAESEGGGLRSTGVTSDTLPGGGGGGGGGGGAATHATPEAGGVSHRLASGDPPSDEDDDDDDQPSSKRRKQEEESSQQPTGQPQHQQPCCPVVVILIGPPGAGKSTFCAALPKANWVSINQDTVGKGGRKGNRQQCLGMMERALKAGKHVAVDRCGLTAEQRVDFISLAAGLGCVSHALWFNLPKELIHARVLARKNHVGGVEGPKGVGVVKRMMGAKDNSPPDQTKEGFEKITECTTQGEQNAAAAWYAALPISADGWGSQDVLQLGSAPQYHDDAYENFRTVATTKPDPPDIKNDNNNNKNGGGGGGGVGGGAGGGGGGGGGFGAAAGGKNAFALMMGAAAGSPSSSKPNAGGGGGKFGKSCLSGGVSSPSEKKLAKSVAGKDSGAGAAMNEQGGGGGGGVVSAFEKLLSSGARATGAEMKTSSGGKKTSGSGGASSSLPPWKRGLVDIASSPEGKDGVISFDDELVVMRDKYPKGRVHLLVLARDVALQAGPSALRHEHASLLERMASAGRAAAAKEIETLDAREGQSGGGGGGGGGGDAISRRTFRLGFHAVPSMSQLHLHVVSQDLRGDGMKHRKHWNSFATDFFRDVDDVIRELRALFDPDDDNINISDNNQGLGWDEEEAESSLAMGALQCHKCGDGPHKTMPKLFEHVARCGVPPKGEKL